ncbi:large subunit of alpha-aminoadipate reductase, partial [Tulasnella sp. 417]
MSLTSFVRRLVSGHKARFRDEKLGVELDLAYLTDRIIMMGYPASGVESLYRNDGDDVRKFLDHRHGKNYWVFNLYAPLHFWPSANNRELTQQLQLSLEREFLSGDRYPFPDHHAPPLAILALATREMDIYLKQDPDRVVVLHCKAGKGRTGTLACAYLLSTGEPPSAPKLQRSYTDRAWAQLTAEKLIRAVDSEDSDSGSEDGRPPIQASRSAGSSPPKDGRTKELAVVSNQTNMSQTSLDAILDLHTLRRMKAPEKEDSKQKRGVSIASQRRFLLYWSILLMSPQDVPKGFWADPPLPVDQRPKVYLRGVQVRLRESNGMARKAIRAINSALEMAGRGDEKDRGKGEIWISLSRYEDPFVEVLEEWERKTRGKTIGKRKSRVGEEEVVADTEAKGVDIGVHGIFDDGKWDSGKMVKSFARMGEADPEQSKVERFETGLSRTHFLRAVPPMSWVHVGSPVQQSQVNGELDVSSTTDLQGASMNDDEPEEEGVLLEAHREVRAKLYMGEVPFGWFWFIPAFHMPSRDSEASRAPTEFKLTRKEVDFPLGPGSWLIDLTLEMEWAGKEAAAAVPKPPKKEQTPEKTAEIVAGAVAEGDVSQVPGALQAETQTNLDAAVNDHHSDLTATSTMAALVNEKERLERVVARLQNLPAIALPTDYPRPQGTKVVEAAFDQQLSEAAALGLVKLAIYEDETEAENLPEYARPTPFQLLLSSFTVLLHRYTGDTDIVIGSSSASARNPLLLRVHLEPQDPFWAVVRKIQMLEKEAEDDNVSYDAVLEALGRGKDGLSTSDGSASGPLFRVRFFDETDHDESNFIRSTSLTSDLTIFVTRPSSSTHASLIPQISLRILYNALIFNSARIASIIDQLSVLLKAASRDPLKAVGAISLLTPQQKAVLPNATGDLNWCDWKGAITDVFSRNARKHPEKTCVVQSIPAERLDEAQQTQTYTYNDILHASNVLAHHLIKNGVQREEVVMVYAYRSVEMVVAVMAILKAGAIFSVIDPAYPPSRQTIYLKVAKPRALIVLKGAGVLNPTVREFITTELQIRVE